MRRSNNQDSQAVMLASDVETWCKRGHVFVVADGMGAHAAGELASKMAADGIPHNYHKLAELPPPNALRKAIRDVNATIHRRGQTNPEFHGMGTTASCLVLLPQGALCAHVGDSRVYRLRGTRFEQLTFDHSLVWEMSAAGQFSKDSPPSIVPKNIITRSLGPHADVQVDLEGPFPIEVGDIFFLCSDGITAGKVTDVEMGQILQRRCLRPKPRVLVDLANLRGGPDNITVIVVRITNKALATIPENAPELLAIGEDLNERRASGRNAIFLWITAAAFFIGAMVMYSLAADLPWFIKIIPLVASVMFLVFGFLQTMAPETAAMSYLPAGRMLGKGPHTRFECTADRALAQDLAGKTRELQDAATQGNWSLDWSKFTQFSKAGTAALEQKDYGAAVREFGRGVTLDDGRIAEPPPQSQGRRRSR
ncbi:MAG: protein phosphatase 2C domain-containing protein [Pirellulales bacterium]